MPDIERSGGRSAFMGIGIREELAISGWHGHVLMSVDVDPLADRVGLVRHGHEYMSVPPDATLLLLLGKFFAELTDVLRRAARRRRRDDFDAGVDRVGL